MSGGVIDGRCACGASLLYVKMTEADSTPAASTPGYSVVAICERGCEHYRFEALPRLDEGGRLGNLVALPEK